MIISATGLPILIVAASLSNGMTDYSCMTNGQWVAGDANIAWERPEQSAGCLPREERDVPAAVSSISVTRWAGASYSVTFKSDGSVTYDGYCATDHLGCHVGRLAAWRFAKLAELVVVINYFGLDHGYFSDATDQEVVVTAVTQFGCEKAVMDYGGVGPVQLWALEQMIAAAVSEVEWSD